ncbi:ATP-binding protein [Telmatospirillum sp.]|uniref:ATP-binding protein n=1 Tax=Telmatospirillum sp. TaxID=2079197 RepID=UPI00283D13BB|nr:ATP-binding protein [Telmatospirillum sp.]MDR3439367.1 ATP-binding protein [Telmatospirillum sp.]
MRIRDLTLRTKVYGAFAIVLSLDVLSGFAAIYNLGRIDTDAAGIRDVWLPAVSVLGDMVSGVENYRIIEGKSLLTQDEMERLSSEELLWNARDHLYLLRSAYERSRSHGQDEDRLIETFDNTWREYQSHSRTMLGYVFRGGKEMETARDIYNGEGERGFRDSRDRLQEVLAFNVNKGKQATETSKQIYTLTTITIVIVTLGAALLSWLLGVFIVRSVTKPVSELIGVMRRMAEDDLTAQTAPGNRHDEIGVMRTALHELRERLLERRKLIDDEKESLRKLQTAERELLAAERLAALGRMVAGVSHEINTPLGSAYTVATTLVSTHQEFAGIVAENRLKKSDLDTFVERVGRASGLIAMTLQKASDLIRTFKQVAVDQTSSSRRIFELRELTRQVVLTTSPLFKHRPFTLDIRIDETIELDSFPGPLGQVLSNLMSNAVLHGLDGRDNGTVVIEATRQGDQTVTISVIDDGVGILPEHRPHLFEPFFTTRFGQGGSGLGLNIVHGIVTHVLGGFIDVDSMPGKGARFALTIPLKAPEQVEGSCSPHTETAKPSDPRG